MDFAFFIPYFFFIASFKCNMKYCCFILGPFPWALLPCIENEEERNRDFELYGRGNVWSHLLELTPSFWGMERDHKN